MMTRICVLTHLHHQVHSTTSTIIPLHSAAAESHLLSTVTRMDIQTLCPAVQCHMQRLRLMDGPVVKAWHKRNRSCRQSSRAGSELTLPLLKSRFANRKSYPLTRRTSGSWWVVPAA